MIEKLKARERDDGFLEPATPSDIHWKINELVDAVNKHEDIIRQIGEWGSSKGECLWCKKLTKVNLDDRMIGCTTLDIPESYKKSCRMDKEFAEEECKRLQDELERTRKVLNRAKWWLNEIVESHRCTPISTAEMALKEITALEQKDAK